MYHVYNRGNNGSDLFMEQRNYAYFLEKYRKFVLPVAHLYAYCLMKNHFHFFVCIKSEEEIRAHFNSTGKPNSDVPIEKLVSKAFNSFFKSYSVTINSTYNRTGRLFEAPHLRKEVTSPDQITNLIRYIHLNPQKHRITLNFRDYPYHSFHDLISSKDTWLARKEVMNWFINKEEFIKIHEEESEELIYDLETNLYL